MRVYLLADCFGSKPMDLPNIETLTPYGEEYEEGGMGKDEQPVEDEEEDESDKEQEAKAVTKKKAERARTNWESTLARYIRTCQVENTKLEVSVKVFCRTGGEIRRRHE